MYIELTFGIRNLSLVDTVKQIFGQGAKWNCYMMKNLGKRDLKARVMER
jgi:hypothetical protein